MPTTIEGLITGNSPPQWRVRHHTSFPDSLIAAVCNCNPDVAIDPPMQWLSSRCIRIDSGDVTRDSRHTCKPRVKKTTSLFVTFCAGDASNLHHGTAIKTDI